MLLLFWLIPDAPPEREEATLDLVRYWRAIRRNKWRILALVMAIGVLAALYANSLPPLYRATATILIDIQKPKIVSIEEVYNRIAGNREFYQTQLEIMKSRELAAKLVKKMKLAEHPLLDPRKQPPPWWNEWLPDGFLIHAPAGSTVPAEATEQRVAGAVQAGRQGGGGRSVRNVS